VRYALLILLFPSFCWSGFRTDYLTVTSSATLPRVAISTITWADGTTSTTTASSSSSGVCGNSGDVQVNFNGSCSGVGGGVTGSVTGGVSSIGINNGIITSATGNGDNLFVSTFSATDLNGFKMYMSSGSIGAASAVTITIPGTTQLWFPMVSESETVNTAVVSIRVKNITANSYQIYNSDAINAKAYITSVMAK